MTHREREILVHWYQQCVTVQRVWRMLSEQVTIKLFYNSLGETLSYDIDER